MKLIPTTLLIVIFSLLLLTALIEVKNPKFNIRIANLSDRDLPKDGIVPAEFGELTISPTDDNTQIKTLQITLARGNRAVEISNIKSNQFNLGQYKRVARSGDRIVISITMMNKNNDLHGSSNAVITIPVN